MKLSSAIENYVALKHSLGAVFSVDAQSCTPSAMPWGTFPSKPSPPRTVGSFAAAKAFPLAFGKENINRCGASSATSWLEDTCSGPRYTTRLHESNGLSIPPSTRTMRSEGYSRQPLKSEAVVRCLSPRLSGP